MTFFSSPNLILEMISNDRIFLGTNAEVKHHIVSWLESSATLQADLTAEKKFTVISHCTTFYGLIMEIVSHLR